MSDSAGVTLGVPQFHYSVDRNILGTQPHWTKVRRPRDLRRLLLSGAAKVGIRTPSHWPFLFGEPYLPRVDLIHSFNAAANVRIPWVATFEAVMPRIAGPATAREILRRLRMIQRSQCRQILAMSQSAAQVTTADWHSRVPPAEVDSLGAKMSILHPPQVIYETYEVKSHSSRPLFAVVGRNFYRKGGLEFLEACFVLWQRRVRDWDAVVVGSLESYGDYASKTDRAAEQRARWLIEAMQPHVKHHTALPAPAVHELFRQATYHVLPTLADTYGYSVLEAQAHAAVCITTNIRALPELVDDSTGIRLDLPVDELGDIHRHPRYAAVRQELVATLADALEQAVNMSDNMRRSYADAATTQLRERHCPHLHMARLSDVYRNAMDGRVASST